MNIARLRQQIRAGITAVAQQPACEVREPLQPEPQPEPAWQQESPARPEPPKHENDSAMVAVAQPAVGGKEPPHPQQQEPPPQRCVDDHECKGDPPFAPADGPQYDDDNDYGFDNAQSLRPVDEIEIVAFRLGNEEYAVRIMEMQEVLMMHEVTWVPRTPSYLMGITSLRGKVIPVIDLREKLRIPGGRGEDARILVLGCGGEPIGARVDSISGVIRITQDEIMASLTTLSEEESRYIEGVVRVKNRFVSILSLGEIMKIELQG
ncbi:MAG: purine-binding chemotaxis protein CheW [Nitrospirae bacterium]|nr:purine-binding chemotaxis protein CheW [Nitrospirota bacterium]